jgi:NAD+ diphosphatase
MLAPAIESEIAGLAARYGTPQRVDVALEGRPFRPLSATDRIGEVCMVLRRKNGKLLTAVKTFYPPGAFRLLTGGIDHGETIEAALLRETAEETGLDVIVRRFLALIEYHLAGSQRPELASSGSAVTVPAFVTFAFLLDEVGGTLAVQDLAEQHGAFHEAAIDDLPALAETLERVPDGFHPEIDGSWRDWGHFRAIVHRVVYDALRQNMGHESAKTRE